MVTHSSVLAWRIPGMAEPGGLPSMGLQSRTRISSANSNIFTFSFPIWITFISFSCVIAVARTFKTMFNESDENEYPCLIPDLRGNAFSFLPLSLILSVGLSYLAFLMLRYTLPMPTFWSF